jgi:hypothetical protein
MRAIMLITDSEVVPEFERVLLAEGHQGFTVVPAVAGSGRHGLKTGDRFHPGGSSLLLTVAREDAAPSLLDLLRRTRDAAGQSERTRMWSFAVEEAD